MATEKTSTSAPATLGRRRRREQQTVDAMMAIYCHAHHPVAPGFPRNTLCADCEALQHYAQRRLARCVFAEKKPTCARCAVHCYSAAMQARIREVMRYAGPRMLLRHPWLALCHLADGWRRVPTLQEALMEKRVGDTERQPSVSNER